MFCLLLMLELKAKSKKANFSLNYPIFYGKNLGQNIFSIWEIER